MGNKGFERLRHLVELVLLVQLLALPSVGTAEGAGEETVRKYTLFGCIHYEMKLISNERGKNRKKNGRGKP